MQKCTAENSVVNEFLIECLPSFASDARTGDGATMDRIKDWDAKNVRKLFKMKRKEDETVQGYCVGEHLETKNGVGPS